MGTKFSDLARTTQNAKLVPAYGQINTRLRTNWSNSPYKNTLPSRTVLTEKAQNHDYIHLQSLHNYKL